MFVWKEKRNQKDELEKLVDLESSWRGSNRRAIGLVPMPFGTNSERQVLEARRVRYQQLLISIEGKQSTCCLRVISPRRKSRSALLVFRGKALGCVYGRKDLSAQILGPEAYQEFRNDLADPESIVDSYILPEELALAAGALFHGDVYRQPADLGARATFDYCYKHLVQTELPGCIVVKHNRAHGVIAFVYIFGGRIVGTFSFSEGWLAPEDNVDFAFLDAGATIEVNASKLNAYNIWQVSDLSFSLTGLSEIPFVRRDYLQPIDLLL